MQVQVDYDVCEANGLCMAEAPQVFRLDDDDMLHVLQEQPPEEQRPAVEAAARACPKRAITVL